MADTPHEIPDALLPKGFAQSLDQLPSKVAIPRLAATIVLLRDGARGPEALLLKRNRKTGFLPGAYVFPGGLVDSGDAGTADSWQSLDPTTAQRRLNLPADAMPPAVAYYTAALREAFEETGLLIGARGSGPGTKEVIWDRLLADAREELLSGTGDFAGLITNLGTQLDGSAVEYIAHWVTPEVEARRYDTRFFAAKVEPEAEAMIDEREMSVAVWLTPKEALDRCQDGLLPMVFPTIHTLEAFLGFDSVDGILHHHSQQDIPRLLPTLEKTATGVALRLP